MPLADYQLAYRNKTIGNGTAIPVKKIDGLEGQNVRAADRDFPRGDGQLPGLHLVQGRIITLETEVWSSTGSQAFVEAELTELFTAFSRSTGTEHEFTFKYPDQTERMVRARTIRRTRNRSHKTERGMQPVLIALKATDPRIYSSEELSVALTEFDPTVGIQLPIVNFPINWAVGTSGEVTIQNLGDTRAYPTIRFVNQEGATSGTEMQIDNLTTGKNLTIQSTVTAGKTLIADFDAHIRGTGELVISLDGSTRYGDWVVPREPFYLEPGFNTLRFSVQPTALDMTAQFNWRHTYLG